jgi:hypothetical protein
LHIQLSDIRHTRTVIEGRNKKLDNLDKYIVNVEARVLVSSSSWYFGYFSLPPPPFPISVLMLEERERPQRESSKYPPLIRQPQRQPKQLQVRKQTRN